MDFEHQLSEDFLFFLELRKDPEQVFQEGSKELQLAQMWMHYLSSYPCENVSDRRIVNVYMSHLCVALIQEKLYGPFLKEPLDAQLDNIEFHMILPSANVSSAMGSNLSQVENENIFPSSNRYVVANPTGCMNSPVLDNTIPYCDTSSGGTFSFLPSHCTPKPCPCGRDGRLCDCNRQAAGADAPSLGCNSEDVVRNYLMRKQNFPPELLQNFDASLTFFMDLCKSVSVEGRTQISSYTQLLDPSASESVPRHQVFAKHHQLLSEKQMDIVSTPSSHENEEFREDISELLEAISGELRGDIEPGTNDYLERELARYKVFVMSHPNLALHLTTLTTDMKLRHFLLLSLQNDLIKLLSEDLSDVRNN